MSEGRKQAVSIRLGASDLRNLRKLARRLGVRHSDLVRYAIKSTLARLSPLHDTEQRGKALVPVFVEAGAELMRYLDLDDTDIDNIINEGASQELRVEREDVQLLAISGAPHPYARLRLVNAANPHAPQQAAGDRDAMGEEQLLNQSLRRYFYNKYVYDGAQQDAALLQAGAQSR
jgi:hypothetical protein